MASVTHLWRRSARTPLIRNTAWMFFAQVGRLVVQGTYFVVVGRALGVEGFGTFAGALALVTILAAFASWGTGNILIMHVARDPSSFPTYWGNALLTILAGGSLLTLVALGLRAALVPVLPVGLVLALAASELLLARVVEVAAQAFQAFERLGYTARLYLLLSVCRLTGALAFVTTIDSPTATRWGVWYLAFTALAALVTYVQVTRILGAPTPAPALIFRHLRDGWYFSIALASQTTYTDIDKTFLARYASAEATGIYSAAYRVINMAFAPVRSLLQASYARFFRHGADGIEGSLAFARRLFPFSVAYGLLATVGLLGVAPVVPHLFGPGYAEVVEALRWLAVLPLLQSIHYFAADSLTGAGYQKSRSQIQIGVAVVNVGLNLWLIPLYSWRGAAAASLAADGALAVGLWAAVGYFYWSERQERKESTFEAGRRHLAE
jgi:O-antigen/teichoic acid export membrane protein